jgi:hypothetical protein
MELPVISNMPLDTSSAATVKFQLIPTRAITLKQGEGGPTLLSSVYRRLCDK